MDIMPSGEEYATIIARNILSGKNRCGTLQNAVEAGDVKYFTNAAKPVVDTLLSQVHQAEFLQRTQGMRIERLRYALEILVQNLYRPPGKEFLALNMDKAISAAIDIALERQVDWP